MKPKPVRELRLSIVIMLRTCSAELSYNDREQKILQIIDIIDMTNTTQFEKIVLIDSMCGENTICRNTLYKKYIIGN